MDFHLNQKCDCVVSWRVYLNRFGQIDVVDVDSHFSDNVVVRVPIEVQHLQNQLLALQLIPRHGELEVLIEMRMLFASMDNGLAFSRIHFGIEHQANIRITETAFFDGVQVVGWNIEVFLNVV